MHWRCISHPLKLRRNSSSKDDADAQAAQQLQRYLRTTRAAYALTGLPSGEFVSDREPASTLTITSWRRLLSWVQRCTDCRIALRPWTP